MFISGKFWVESGEHEPKAQVEPLAPHPSGLGDYEILLVGSIPVSWWYIASLRAPDLSRRLWFWRGWR